MGLRGRRMTVAGPGPGDDWGHWYPGGSRWSGTKFLLDLSQAAEKRSQQATRETGMDHGGLCLPCSFFKFHHVQTCTHTIQH